MKRVCSDQCRACPFRSTSAPGWLGAYQPHEVINAAWRGASFFCHTRTNYNRPGWRERAEANGQLCRGFLIFRERMMAPESPDPEIRAAQVQAVAAAAAEPSSVDVMDGEAFNAHHCMDPAERGAFMQRMFEAGTPCRL